MLRSLVEAGHEVAVVVSRADKRRGRRGGPAPSPVKAAALELGLPASESADAVGAAGVELGVVVAFGRLVEPGVLEQVPMVNVHFSLLPRWRGAAPVERSILAGDAVTGVSLMALDEGLDTGPVYGQREVEIGLQETAAELAMRLAGLGASMLVAALRGGLGEPAPQVGEPTYAPKLTSEDRHLDWRQPAALSQRVVRVGRAWTTWRGRRLLVLAAEPVRLPDPASGEPGSLAGDVVVTGDGGLRLLWVQPAGRPPVRAADWLRGARLLPGEALGS